MATLKVVDTSGKKLTSMKVADELVGVSVNSDLLAQAVRVYQSNQRQSGTRTKTRAEIAYSGGKLWRQKGTGRARHSSRRAPIFVGGSKAHGPTGRENHSMTLSKKMRQRAILQAISLKHQEGKLLVVDGLKKVEPKTKQVESVLSKTCDYPKTKKVLMVLEDSDQPVIRGSENLGGVSATQAKRINVFEILNNDTLVLTKEAVKVLEERVKSSSKDTKTASTASKTKKATSDDKKAAATESKQPAKKAQSASGKEKKA